MCAQNSFMNRKLRFSSFLLGAFRCNGSFSIRWTTTGLFWSPCTWPYPTSGCSLWVPPTLCSRNGAWHSSYDATQHSEIKVSWPEDGCSSVSAAAGGMSVKEIIRVFNRSYFYYQSSLAFHVVLLLIIACISCSDDPCECQSQHQVHAECQTWGLPSNAASGLLKCHGVAATRWQQYTTYCCSIRWPGRATACNSGFLHHSVFNTSTDLKVLQRIHELSSAYYQVSESS